MKLRYETKLELKGRWKLTALYKGTNKIYKVLEGGNLITTVGKAFVGNLLIDKAGWTIGITYHAIGTSNTAPVVGDVKLTVETTRKAVTAKTQASAPNTNQFTWSTFYAAGECTYNIKEGGAFGHDATVTPDSGVIFSHYLVAFDNSAGAFDLIFDYILTIG